MPLAVGAYVRSESDILRGWFVTRLILLVMCRWPCRGGAVDIVVVKFELRVKDGIGNVLQQTSVYF